MVGTEAPSVDNKPRILPVVWLLLSVLGMAVLDRVSPLVTFVRPPWNWLGLAPLVLGSWMAAVSARSFRRAGTGLLPFGQATALVTHGFFRYTRNPMYLGMVLFLAGVAVLLGSLSSVLPVPLFAGIIQRNFILGEERFMEQAFGQDYLAYKSRVGRWL